MKLHVASLKSYFSFYLLLLRMPNYPRYNHGIINTF